MFQSVSVVDRGVPDVLVVGQFQGEDLDARTRRVLPASAYAAARRRGEATGEAGRITELLWPRGRRPAAARRVLLIGLGPRARFRAGDLRAVAAAVGRRAALARDEVVRVDLIGPLQAAGIAPDAGGLAFGEGVGLLSWTCDQFKGTGSTVPTRTPLRLQSPEATFTAGLRRGLALAESANFARTLSETPPNIATPDWMADQARDLARRVGLRFSVMRGDELRRQRLLGLLTVGAASEHKPCLIRLEYRPRRVRPGARPVVLIGKTMCYDTGGLSLKINNTMAGMKRDKDGGCAVLGAMDAVARTVRPPVPVVALLPAAENAISDEAYRPDDIIRYRNGVTVEVTNTDAEGRLVLADALCWACEKEQPACIVELSTLTGGIVIALGSTYAGCFCDDDALRSRLERASEASGERIWRMPLHQEYRDLMKSTVADILNSNPNRKAHPIQGAAFLSYFVREGVPWAHIDIAGVHAVDADSGPFVKGPTGWGVRLLAHFLAQEQA